MKIYEAGHSVANRVVHKLNKTNNYICSFEQETTAPIDHTFLEMQKSLEQGGFNIVTIDNKTYTVTDSRGDTYTLIHERKFTAKDEVECVNSNILRYIFTRPFTRDCLFVNDDGEITDLTHRALHHVEEQRIATQTNFADEIRCNNDIILQCVDFLVSERYRMDDRIIETFFGTLRTTQRINAEHPLLKKMLNDNTQRFLRVISDYGGLQDYFYKTCGMTIGLNFNPLPPVEIKPLPKKAAKFNVRGGRVLQEIAPEPEMNIELMPDFEFEEEPLVNNQNMREPVFDPIAIQNAIERRDDLINIQHEALIQVLREANNGPLGA